MILLCRCISKDQTCKRNNLTLSVSNKSNAKRFEFQQAGGRKGQTELDGSQLISD